MFEYKYECYKCDACSTVNEDGTGRCFAMTGCFMYMPGDGDAAPLRGCMGVDSPCSNRGRDSTGTCHICHENLCNSRTSEKSPSMSPSPLASASLSPQPMMFPAEPAMPVVPDDSQLPANCTTTPLSPPFGPDPTAVPNPDADFKETNPDAVPGDSLGAPHDSSVGVGAPDDADPPERIQLDDKGETDDPDCYKESKEQVGPSPDSDRRSMGSRESDAKEAIENRGREQDPRPGIQTNLLDDKTGYDDGSWVGRIKERGKYGRKGKKGRYGSSNPPRLMDNSVYEPHFKNEPVRDDGPAPKPLPVEVPAPVPVPMPVPGPGSILRPGKTRHEIPIYMQSSRNKVEARGSLKLFPKKAASVAVRSIPDAPVAFALAVALAHSLYVQFE